MIRSGPFSLFSFLRMDLSVRFTRDRTVQSINGRDGRVVMQRPAKPWTPVRFRLPPPKLGQFCVRRCARVAKLVDARDLKSRAPQRRAGSIPALGTTSTFRFIPLFLTNFFNPSNFIVSLASPIGLYHLSYFRHK